MMPGMDAVAEQTGEQTPKRKAPKTAFKKGRSGNPKGRPVKLPPEPPMPDGLVARDESQLEAMRCVLQTMKPETFQQWQMFRWYQTDQKGFLASKVTLERMASPQKSGADGSDSGAAPWLGRPLPLSGGPVLDLGTDRVLELAGELIERLAKGV